METLPDIACQLYIDDQDFCFIGITEVGMLPIQTEDIEYENKHVILEKDSIFANFIKFIIDNPRLNDIQKNTYLKHVSAETKIISY